jgi:hypothetical protein
MEARRRSSSFREPRVALWGFVAIELGALVYYFVLARGQWFFADEWDFLARRSLSPKGLLAPHLGHWTTVPIMAYRVLWQLFGLRSYMPYVGLTIGLHLTAAALLRAIMRRSGIRPWTATAGASVFVFFGAGAQNIFWAFQITFVGALVLGLVQVLLADHAGGVDRRDWFGLAAGVLGLLCSGVYITMAIVVGITVLLKRGWRAAALHTVPLAVLYVGWWARFLRRSKAWRRASSTSPGDVLAWCWRGATGLFAALGHVSLFGIALFVVFVVGSFVALRRLGRDGIRERGAVPLGLALGVLALLLTTGTNRGQYGAGGAASSRYEYILAALLLPALVLAVDALIQNGRVVGVFALVVLFAGVPGNIVEASRVAHERKTYAAGLRSTMLSIARDPLAERVPGALRPEPNVSGDVSLAWLRRGITSGRIPKLRAPSPVEESNNRLRLSLMELDRASGFACRRLDRPTVLRLGNGESVGIGGTVYVALLSTEAAPASEDVAFGSALLNQSPTHTLVAVAGPIVIRMTPLSRVDAASIVVPLLPPASKQITSLCQQPDRR